MTDDRPFETADGIWTATAGSEPLCASCERKNFDSRVRVMCLADPKRVTAWTCRDYSLMPGAFG